MQLIRRALLFRPDLLAIFSVISFVLIMALGVLLASGIQQKVEESAVRQQANHAADLVRLYIAPRVRPDELIEPWDPGSARFAELDEIILTTMLRDHTVRIKLWSKEGVVLYSDQRQLIGEKFELEEDQIEALEGNIHYSRTGLDAEENEFERSQFDQLLEIYIPFRAGNEPDPGAVFEIYHDLDAVEALNSEVSSFTWSAVGLGFIALYASLFVLVYRASRRLARQSDENAHLYREASQRLVERMEIEQDLRERVEFERLVMAISTNFINLDTHDLDNGMTQALRAVGTYLDVGRCYVLRFENEGKSALVTHEWCAPGVVPVMRVTGSLRMKALPWAGALLQEGEAVHIPQVAALPAACSAEREFFSAMGSKAVLLVPMVYNKTLVGALGIDRVDEPGQWSEDRIGLLKVVGEILINASERQRAEEAIRESEQRFRAVFEGAAFAIAIVDRYGRVVESNKPVHDLLGYTGEELKTMNFAQISHPDDVNLNIDFFRELFEGKRRMYSMEKRYIQKGGEIVWVNLLVSALCDAKGVPTLALSMLQDVTDRKRAQEEIKRQFERLNALRTIDNAIISSFDLNQTLDVVLGQIITQLNVDAADVLVLNQRTGSLEYAAGFGFRTDSITRTRLRMGEGNAGRAALERRIVYLPNIHDRADFSRLPLIQDEKFVSYFALPLVVKGKVVGVLEVYNRTLLEPGPEWRDFLETLSGQTAIAVDNALLFQDLQRYNLELSLAYDTTLEGWSRALDLRDKETEGHTQRVTEMTVRLARSMGIDEAGLVHIRRGALLHDIGKMGIPDAILLKPGPLTDDEWEIMRLHPLYAYELLSPILFLHPALDIPYCHHEKWDGTGYPRGLRGEEIPLAARIFAIVDVYDALRSDRPYRVAWPEERVLEHLRSLSGTHFDPVVVDAFMKMDRAQYRRTPTTPELLITGFL